MQGRGRHLLWLVKRGAHTSVRCHIDELGRGVTWSVDLAMLTQCVVGSMDSGARLLGLESCCAPYWPCNRR